MNLFNAIGIGLKEIWAHKFRSLLTMLGIILGVSSLVSMSALVKGMLATSATNPGIRAISVQAVRFVTPDVAIVDGEYRTGTDTQRLWTTLIVKREAKGWRIAGIRNMAPTGQAK